MYGRCKKPRRASVRCLRRVFPRGLKLLPNRGVETAVLVPIEQWRRMESMTKPDLKELLLASEARTDTLTPPRAEQRRRAAIRFE